MIYIIKNLILTIKNELLIFVLIILCTLSSVIVIHFSFGLYQNYHVMIEEHDGDMKEINIEILDPKRVSKEKMKDCVLSLSEDTTASIIMVALNPKIDPFYQMRDEWGEFTVRFTIQNQTITPCRIFADNIKANGALTSGSYFSNQEEANGNLVAISGPIGHLNSCTDNITVRQEDDIRWVEIQGKEYKVVGTQKISDCPFIPFQSLDDDTIFINSVFIGFKEMITRSQYDNLKYCFETTFGDAISFPELDIPENSDRYLYHTILCICATISILAATNFTVLYRYIFEQRKKQIAIFLLCGCQIKKAFRVFFVECLFMIVPVYAVSVYLFSKVLLPRLTKLYPYMSGSFSTKSYLALFGIFTTLTLISIIIMICISFHKQILVSLNGREH